jgi:hypothetical protein
VRDLSNRNFGLVIAYLIPGFVMLWGVGFVDERVANWLEGVSGSGPTVGGFFYVLISSIGFGMVASAVRWAVIDQIHSMTGLKRPPWSDKQLHVRLPAYTWIIENYYRYYQFYGNTIIALIFTYAVWRTAPSAPFPGFGWLDASMLILLGILFAGSRSALTRYYDRRAGVLLAEEERELTMTNGGGHHETDPKKPTTKDKKRDACAGVAEAEREEERAEQNPDDREE